jgi:Nucleotidyl transferase AbiEii toxin, Type IV TA system
LRLPRRHPPEDVLPAAITKALGTDPHWFVIGGHAVRCFCPYRPSIDVDFGVVTAKDLQGLLRELRTKGTVEVLERAEGTVHLRFDDMDVSIFVLPDLRAHTEDRTLTVTGVLATKLHAILDRGTRRDFFDLYVMMEQERLGLIDCFRAIREVYRTDVNEGLLLRAVTYFDDADSEASLPGEGRSDWKLLRTFFMSAAGALLAPPPKALAIQANVVDVRVRKTPGRPSRSKK